MVRYYAISEHGTFRDRIEITNKQVGRFKISSEEIVFDDTTMINNNYNRLTIICAEPNGEKTVFKKIGVIEMLNFTISDCNAECVQKMLAKCIRLHEKKKDALVERFEFPFLLELAYSPWKHKNKYRKLTFEEEVRIPVEVLKQDG